MMGDTHALGGVLTWTLVSQAAGMPLSTTLVGVPIAAAAALGPDIDHPNSAISRVAWPVSKLVCKVTTHRVQTHSLLALAAVYLVSQPLGVAAAAAVASGWGNHILIDGVSRDGVAWLWPLSGRRVSLLRWLPRWLQIRTNGMSEKVFAGIMCIGFVGFEAARLISG